MLDGRKRSASNAEISNTHHALPREASSESIRGTSNKGGRVPPSMADSADGAWEIAESKASRKNKKRKTRHDDDGTPSIKFLTHAAPDQIQAKALQELILYVLTGSVAPTWLAVNNARNIKKVVVLMIPGLAREMLDSEILKKVHADADEEVIANGTPLRNVPSERPLEDGRAESQLTSHSGRDNEPVRKDAAAPTLVPPLVQHILKVRAPGDSRACKVHSPLQGMLIVPDSANKNSSQSEKAFKAVRTPITSFVHTADELSEAQYPVHHALFTDPVDAETEKTRRENASQSASSGWVDSAVSVSSPCVPTSASPGKEKPDFVTQGLTVYAVDCEMVLTSDELHSLARISVVDWSGATILDRYVKPSLPIQNYFTQFSGITPEVLKDVTTTLSDIQSELLALLTPSTVLLGHSLDSDLAALKLTHPFIIDTSIIYPHPRGLPLRSSLKFLANRYLKREIQQGGANGHDSIEDARAVLDLVKLKCEKGPRWGTSEANGESIFRKIGRANRSTAIVEYGTPEKGLGRDATYAIGCESDADIVRGVLRAVRGDTVPATSQTTTTAPKPVQQIPPGGVDFVWSRFRALEAARGWNDHSPSQSTPHDDEADAAVADSTLTHLAGLYARLPSQTLLVLYSGTSDMRPFLALQAQQAQFRREFKVRKWDELEVKWTDVEQQALGRAAEDARRGWGVLAIR